MSTQLAKTEPAKPSALAVMASRYNVEPSKLLLTLKDTVFKGANESELLALVVVANEYGLNPLTKEIYAFPAKGGGITPIVSIDGWTRIINQHPQMDGIEFEFEHDDAGNLVSCTAILWRKDRNRPVKVTEYFAECKRNTEPWKMEHRMLRHKALIQAARVAFGFAGIYDEDEAERIKAAQAIVIQSDAPKSPSFKRGEPVQIEAPEFVADTPQKKIANNLAESEIAEADFLKLLKTRKIDAETVAGLSDEIANDILESWDAISEALK